MRTRTAQVFLPWPVARGTTNRRSRAINGRDVVVIVHTAGVRIHRQYRRKNYVGQSS